jgi:GNAT superfamily N-acetyltransferase
LSEIILRTATAVEAPVIAALHAESWRSAYANAMRAEYLAGPIEEERLRGWEQRFAEQAATMHVTLCALDGQAAGFACTFAPDGDQYGALLDNIHVRPHLKGRGLGALLLRSSAQWVAENFAGSGLHLWVLKANEPAQKFYDRLGGIVRGDTIETLPDGSALPEWRYHWEQPELLARGDQK